MIIPRTNSGIEIKMLTEKDKTVYEQLTKNRRINRSFYSLAKWLFEKPLRHLFLDLTVEGLENIESVKDKPSIFVPYHCLAIEEPLLGEIIDDYAKKPHALIDLRVFSRRRTLYGLLEEVPFNTSCKRTFEEDYKWSMDKARRWLELGESILVFNDGDTAHHKEMMIEKNLRTLPLYQDDEIKRPNSPIPARLSFETNSPVVPIATYSPLEYEKQFYTWDNWKSWLNLIASRKIPYVLEFLKPIYPQESKNRGEMRKEIRERQLEAYKRRRL